MKKISINNLVEFRSKSPKSKHSFAADLKSGKEKVSTGKGGNYWVSCVSAINKSYKLNDFQPLANKRDELAKKSEETSYKRTLVMYKRNIDILYTFEKFDLEKWRPSKKIEYIRKPKEYSTLTIKELQIQVNPNYIFRFKKDGIEEIGAIWFIAKINGFKKEELGMFADILYRFLDFYYSEKYVINPQYCIAVDLFNGSDINYLHLKDGKTLKILDSILDEIKELR
ncbi:hypothetical protein [uncultured Bacteroides sp.]|uniref:hypothetical protein n=1 Tax=uncultured Bacteroides sp. TaxID=162156 RepID=UPI002AA6F6D8|nr:hypothetical protein [uncultured Bacteroides sp.]